MSARHFTNEEKDKARAANLVQMLKDCYPDEISERKNDKSNRGFWLRIGADGEEDWNTFLHENGYYDQKEGKLHNAVDYLMNFHGMSFPDAVEELLQYQDNATGSGMDQSDSVAAAPQKTDVAAVSPEQIIKAADNEKVITYLCQTRKIHPKIVNRLIEQGLIWQEAESGNAVFSTEDGIPIVVYGTDADGKPFKRSVRAADGKQRYWHCENPLPNGDISRVLVTEDVIDAISLYELSGGDWTCGYMYVSMEGVENTWVIDDLLGRLNDPHDRFYDAYVTIATDNDEAGNACASKYPKISREVPDIGRDWNEKLRKKKCS